MKTITVEDVNKSLEDVSKLRKECWSTYLERLMELNQLEEDLIVLKNDFLEYEKTN
jgi:transketolase C-terminal domain/subunit